MHVTRYVSDTVVNLLIFRYISASVQSIDSVSDTYPIFPRIHIRYLRTHIGYLRIHIEVSAQYRILEPKYPKYRVSELISDTYPEYPDA